MQGLASEQRLGQGALLHLGVPELLPQPQPQPQPQKLHLLQMAP